MDHLGVINTTMWLVIDWWVLMALIVWLVVGRLDGRWEGTFWAWKPTVLVVVGFGGERFGTCKQTAHVGMVNGWFWS